MSDSKPSRPKARLPRGFRDRPSNEIAAERAVLETVRRVYESYGFSPLETPAFEYTDALGKFLPDLDRPNEGVFSLQDDDGQWLSLRYDLTAPLARYVAANFQNLTKPFRRYQLGPVWRNEKPGPGRFREFLQFDADTVGSASPSADAELLMMLSDAMEALGLKRGDYIVKLNNRKLLDEVMQGAGVDLAQRGTVLVLPALNCSLPWLTENDPRLLVLHDAAGEGAACYVGAHSYEFCWPWDRVAFQFDPNVRTRAALLGTDAAGGDELLLAQPAPLQPGGPEGEEEAESPAADARLRGAMVQKQCPDYFA